MRFQPDLWNVIISFCDDLEKCAEWLFVVDVHLIVSEPSDQPGIGWSKFAVVLVVFRGSSHYRKLQ
jgi:hypothetical protein